MARMARSEVFNPDEVATVHVSNRCVRGLFLMGENKVTGENYSHRREWFRLEMQRCTNYFAIDLLEHAIMQNHFHMLLRSRPDIVQCWNNSEVARRWLKLCPKRKNKDGTPKDPTKAELRSLTKDPDKIKAIRKRLSDISWFVRKICQPVAQRANREVNGSGKFWDTRFKAVRLLDEEAVLACSAYINLNPIRAIMAYTLEQSQFTSIEQRIADLVEAMQAALTERQALEQLALGENTLIDHRLDDSLPGDHVPSDQAFERLDVATSCADLAIPELYSSLPPKPREEVVQPATSVRSLADVLTEQLDKVRAEMAWEAEDDDAETPEMLELRQRPPEPFRAGGYLSPLEINEALDPLGPRLSRSQQRCSDRGYLPMTIGKYIEMLEWCARQIRPDKRGFTPEKIPPIVERLGIPEEVWLKLVTSFGDLFSVVAGMPESIDAHRGSRRQHFHMPQSTRELLTFTPTDLQSELKPAITTEAEQPISP